MTLIQLRLHAKCKSVRKLQNKFSYEIYVLEFGKFHTNTNKQKTQNSIGSLLVIFLLLLLLLLLLLPFRSNNCDLLFVCIAFYAISSIVIAAKQSQQHTHTYIYICA